MFLSSASLIRPAAHAQSISCLYVHLFLGTFFLILDLRRWSLASRPANTEAASAELHGELNVGPPCQWPSAVAEQQEAALTAVGFEPTPLRNGALSHRLRPLGQAVFVCIFLRALFYLMRCLCTLCLRLYSGGRPGSQGIYGKTIHSFHRSHFGSRYTLGCCACAGLFKCPLLAAPIPITKMKSVPP